MWKTITQPEQIKNYPVGTRVRINGRSTEITEHYSSPDHGFDIADPVSPYGVDTFGDQHWDNREVIVEVWDGSSLQDELTAALKSVIDLVDRDVIHVRPSERDQFLEALEQWNVVLAKVEESK